MSSPLVETSNVSFVPRCTRQDRADGDAGSVPGQVERVRGSDVGTRKLVREQGRDENVGGVSGAAWGCVRETCFYRYWK